MTEEEIVRNIHKCLMPHSKHNWALLEMFEILRTRELCSPYSCHPVLVLTYKV
jgi:hypothetical protein